MSTNKTLVISELALEITQRFENLKRFVYNSSLKGTAEFTHLFDYSLAVHYNLITRSSPGLGLSSVVKQSSREPIFPPSNPALSLFDSNANEAEFLQEP